MSHVACGVPIAPRTNCVSKPPCGTSSSFPLEGLGARIAKWVISGLAPHVPGTTEARVPKVKTPGSGAAHAGGRLADPHDGMNTIPSDGAPHSPESQIETGTDC